MFVHKNNEICTQKIVFGFDSLDPTLLFPKNDKKIFFSQYPKPKDAKTILDFVFLEINDML
jgi:hypothetical protein